MATKTRRRTPERNPDVTPDVNPEESQAEESGNLFNPQEMKDDDYVRIQRRDDLEKTMVYHGRLAPAEANAERVAELFGGGFYRVQWFQRSERGDYFIKGTRTFKVPGAYKPPSELPGTAKTPGASTTPPGQKPEVGTLDGGTPVQMLNTALVGSVVDLLKTLKAPPPPPPPPAPQLPWGEILTVVVGPLVLKLVERQENGKSEILEIMKQMRELVPSPNPAGPAQSAVSDLVKGMKELMGLKDIVEGKEAPPDPETAMWGAAMKAMDLAGSYITGKKNGDSTPTQPQLPPAGVPGMPKWKLMLLSQRKRLVEAASYNLPPDTAAETAITFLPQQMHGVLTEFLELPDHVDITIQTIPELAEFRNWTEQFMAQLTEQFLGGDEEDAEETERGEASQG